MNISIFGLGYVGCVGMGCLAKQGHVMVGVDVSDEKVKRVNSGQATIVENEIDRNLFYVEPVVYIPKRKLGYVLKNDFCASFAIKEFVKMFD